MATITAFEVATWAFINSPNTMTVTGAVAGDWILAMAGGDQGEPGTDVTAFTFTTTGGSTTAWNEFAEDLTGVQSPWISAAVAQVTANGTVTITGTRAGSGNDWGMCAILASGSSGLGNFATSFITGTAQTASLAVSQGSAVLALFCDWDAAAVGTVWVPASGAVSIERAVQGGNIGIYAAYWPSESAGTRAYGSSGGAGSKYVGIVAELLDATVPTLGGGPAGPMLGAGPLALLPSTPTFVDPWAQGATDDTTVTAPNTDAPADDAEAVGTAYDATVAIGVAADDAEAVGAAPDATGVEAVGAGYEGQTSGVTANSTNSDDFGDAPLSLINAGTGGTVQYSSAWAFTGTMSLRFDGATSAFTAAYNAGTSSSSFAARAMWNPAALNSTESQGPMDIRTAANVTVARLQTTALGRIKIIINGATTVATGTVSHLTSGANRIEFYGTGLGGASGAFTLEIYSGSSLTPLETIGATGVTSTGTAQILQLGRGSAAAANTWYYDAVAFKVGDATPWGAVSGDTTATADVATATGTALDASVAIAATGDTATGAGAALDATSAVAATADVATGAGTALDASVAASASAGVAAATGTATDASAAIVALAEAASAAGTALDATVATSTGTNAPADVATATGAALDATAAIGAAPNVATGAGVALDASTAAAVNAELAAGTGTALDASPATGVNAELASAAGSALDAAAALGAQPNVATAAGAAPDATAAIGVNADAATATGSALDAAAQTSGSTTAQADIATGAGTALDTSTAVTLTGDQATAAGAALDATAALGAQPGNAAGAGTAQDASAALQVFADVATGAGAAFDATVSTTAGTFAPADIAAGTGTALDASTAVQIFAGVATATGSALDATAVPGTTATAGVATGAGTALDATAAVAALAGIALGVGEAFEVPPQTAYGGTLTVTGRAVATLVAAGRVVLTLAASRRSVASLSRSGRTVPDMTSGARATPTLKGGGAR